MVKNYNKIRRIGICVLAGLLIVAALLALGVLLVLKKNRIIFNYDDLGVPYAELYTDEQLNSRLSDDMTVYNGKLYVGGGDYDANTGPVYVMSYDLEKRAWEQSQEPLPDEQIKRFRVLGGKLVTLGTDPKDDWNMGNYYLFDEGEWEILRVLPSGIHCFDAVEFDSMTFFGLGVSSGGYPAVSLDGEEYATVGFFKDGAPLDTSANEIIRVYNFFEFKDTLFAFLTLDKKDENGETVGYYMDLYSYGGNGFEFVSGSLPSEDMPDVATTENEAYFILNKTLLSTKNLTEFSAVNLGEGVKVSDVITDDGKIYVLGMREIREGYFETMVFEERDGSFEKKFGLLTQAAAGSFCKDGKDFYISLGRRDGPAASDMGRVLRVNGR